MSVKNGKATVGGSLTVKAHDTLLTLTATVPGSAVAKNFTVTGGAGPDIISWGEGFNVGGDATIFTGNGEATITLGGRRPRSHR